MKQIINTGQSSIVVEIDPDKIKKLKGTYKAPFKEVIVEECTINDISTTTSQGK